MSGENINSRTIFIPYRALYEFHSYKVVQIWPGLFVCKQVTVCPGHIWTTLYMQYEQMHLQEYI